MEKKFIEELNSPKSSGKRNNIPLETRVLCYISYTILGLAGLLREFLLIVGIEKKYRLDGEPKREVSCIFLPFIYSLIRVRFIHPLSLCLMYVYSDA